LHGIIIACAHHNKDKQIKKEGEKMKLLGTKQIVTLSYKYDANIDVFVIFPLLSSLSGSLRR
jgi:hypothetical protein